MQEKTILIIGLVWPEPTSSAAGTRMVQLLNVFLESRYKVIFASAAAKGKYSAELQSMGVLEVAIELNNDSFNEFVHSLQPDMVMYDRYMIEEQYGWRVKQECPDALTILDTEDLHCLRASRQVAKKKAVDMEQADLFNDIAKREIAAILRTDLSLIISEVELDILINQYGVNNTLLHYLPFLEEPITAQGIGKWRTFEDREGFMFIGNYLHEPNWHTLQILKTEVWPMLRKRLPGVKMHIYGAYASQKVMQLQNTSDQFWVHGRAESATAVMSKHRILLAPIQFGAGVKGKFIDAMQTGTPAVTTSIGAEAMNGNLPWCGSICNDISLFVKAAVSLYTDRDAWLQAQRKGVQILNERYTKDLFAAPFLEHLVELKTRLVQHRRKNFIGQILQHHTLNSLKYMSLWIAEKNSH
jgi:glycosyltransferase involved in cell wall biosynthesis